VVVVVVEVLLVVWLEGQRPSGCALQRSALALRALCDFDSQIGFDSQIAFLRPDFGRP
jgi:hypothetical protein